MTPLDPGRAHRRLQRRARANPLLRMASTARLRLLARPVRHALAALLKELEVDCTARGMHSWHRSKAPMGAYFLAVASIVKHLRRCVVLEVDGEGRRAGSAATPSQPEELSAAASVDRSARADVRNPVLRLPAVAQLRALPAPARAELADALRALQAECAGEARIQWASRRPAAAALHKAAAVYAGHIRRAMNAPPPRDNASPCPAVRVQSPAEARVTSRHSPQAVA